MYRVKDSRTLQIQPRAGWSSAAQCLPSAGEAWNSIPNMGKEGQKEKANIFFFFLSSNYRAWETVQWAKCLLSKQEDPP